MSLNAMKERDSENPTPTLDKEPTDFILHLRGVLLTIYIAILCSKTS